VRDALPRRRAAALVLVACLAACGRDEGGAVPPPLEVRVAPVESAKIPVHLEHVGTTEAVNSVEVRARVRGVLERVLFQEGADVEQGQLLFVIEQAPYRAALDQAQGDLARAEATLERSESDYGRAKELAAANVASQADLDHARAARNEAAASVQAARAAVAQAKLDLGYTEVRAPISGRIGRILVTQGNLVGGTDETVIATIVQLDPIYVYFSPSERERLDVLRLRKEGVYVPREEIEVRAVLADGSEYPEVGKLDFVDNTVDPNVGTVRVRAVFPNPDKTLLPGEYAKLRVLVGREVPALLVPAQAVVEEQGGSAVFVVGPDGTVEARNVVAGPSRGSARVIESGLEAGERVAVDNLGKLRSGTKVQIRSADVAS
jgi:membrane fusion protein (multidrug efflux system)